MAVVFKDTFTEASDILLENHTPDIGVEWKQHLQTSVDVYVAASVDKIEEPIGGSGYYVCFDPIEVSYTISALLTIADGSEGTYGNGILALFNQVSARAGYMVRTRAGSNVWQLYRFYDDASTLIDTISQTMNTDDVFDVDLIVKINGSDNPEFSLVVDGIEKTWDTDGTKILEDTSTENKITGNPGIYARGAGFYIDDFVVDNVVIQPGQGDTISVTSIVDGEIIQRSGTTGSKTISGTYSGIPTAIEYRIVEDGTDTAISGHDWQTLDNSPSGNVFSEVVAGIPMGGWYNVDVRFSNDTEVADEDTNKWGVGVLIGIFGQSQMENWFTDGAGQTPNSLLRMFNESGWAIPGAATNGATSFGNKLATELSIPIGLLDAADGGTSLRDIGDPDGFWLDFTNDPYDNFFDIITAAGAVLEMVLWGQGETDARVSTLTQSEYQTALETFIARVRTDVTNGSSETNLPFLISTLGRDTFGYDDEGYEAVREAQKAVIAGTADCYFASMAIDFALRDTVHYTDANYIVHGQRCAQTALDILGEVTYHRGPYINSITKQSSTIIDVNLVHRGGADFTPITGITGFEAFDDETPITISSAARQDATTIRLTLTSALTGTPTVRYLYGADPVITGVVKDNSGLGLPLEYQTLLYPILPINLPLAWKILAEKSVATSWKLFDLKDQAASWKIFNELNRGAAWKILKSSAANAAWKVMADTNQLSAWKILNSEEKATSYKIINRLEQDSSWAIINRLTRDVSWKILLQGILSREISWKILSEKEQQAAWKVLSEQEQQVAWKIFNEVDQNIAWQILASGQISQSLAWKILNAKDKVVGWRIQTATTQETAWKIINEKSQSTAWDILKVTDQDLAYKIFAELEQDVAWSVDSSVLPQAVKEFTSQKRTFIFNSAKRTFIFYQKEK